MNSVRALVVVVAAACSGPRSEPASNNPQDRVFVPTATRLTGEPTAPRLPQRLDDGRIVVGPFSLVAPAEWKLLPATTSTEVAVLEISSAWGNEARVVVEYFGPRGAGQSSHDVTDRWTAPFLGANSKPTLDYSGSPQTFAAQHAWTAGAEGWLPGESTDHRRMEIKGAIVESPQGPYYFRMGGTEEAIKPNRARWWAMLDSLQLR